MTTDLAALIERFEREAPPTGRRRTLIESLARLHRHTNGGPVTIAEVGTSRRRHRMIEDGHATKALGWYTQTHGGELVSIDTDPLAISTARRLVPAGPHFRLILDKAEDVLGAFTAIDLLYLDGPSESESHGLMWDALTCRPLFVLVDDIFGDGEAVPQGDAKGFHAKHVANWEALRKISKPWAVKGEIVIPRALADGYEIVLHRDRQVLLLDSLAGYGTIVSDGKGAANVHQRPIDARRRRPIPAPRTVPRARHLDNARAIPAPQIVIEPMPTLPADLVTAGPRDPSRALIIGGGSSVWADLADLREMLGGPWDGIVIAVNDVGCHLPFYVDHWTTLHAEKIQQWQKTRRAAGHPDVGATWTRKGARSGQVTHVVTPWGGGASGLLAVAVAHQLGATRVVLCGVPMTRAPHFAQSVVHHAAKPWAGSDSHWRAWNANAAKLAPFVRSFSGRTRELLGPPDLQWLGLSPSLPTDPPTPETDQ
jgi:hypothetical protein